MCIRDREQRDLVGHQLEAVAVAGTDEHPDAAGGGLRRQSGDDVVGLVSGGLDERNVEGVEDLLDERDLALSLIPISEPTRPY